MTKEFKISVKTEYLLLVVALLIFLFNQLPFLVDIRSVKYDEAWYMNPAYNLLNGNGLVNTLVGSGGNANFIVPMLMAGSMAVFGQSLLAARLTAVLGGLIAVFVLHLILNEINANKRARILTYAIFLSVTIINSTFRNVRPEFAAGLFMLIGILFTIRYIRTHSWCDIIGLSVSIYLSSCSHPYALYLFALIGCTLLFKIIQQKEWKRLSHMVLLVAAALLVIISLMYANKIFNHSSDATVFINRLTITSIYEAISTYLKMMFVRHGIYTIPFLLLNIFALIKYKEIRWLTISTILFVVTFPLIFSSDLHMLGNSIIYFSLLSIVLCAYLANSFFDAPMVNCKRRKIIFGLLCLYCLGNQAISMMYNYYRYEKCNSILAKEISGIVPENKLIFGSMRFWPFLMNAEWFCEMNRKQNVPNKFEYIILSSQDVSERDELNPKIVKDVINKIEEYDIVYMRATKQYGLITIYKCKDTNHEHSI